MNKKGVSLIAVLLFMLVATIAATATFKWLTSENMSSASRLQQAQARTAALAGIENARSWMTHNANETGAIIKQYMQTKTPVSLNSVLPPMTQDGKRFSVKLVGVDASAAKSTYKVKIVATGESRNGTTYSEAAILKVTGLYKVLLPKEKKSMDYSFSYFGGSTTFSGEQHSTAMLINGHWGTPSAMNPWTQGANPGQIDNDFIVTGDAWLSGNDISIGGTACVGGYFYPDNKLNVKNVYVAGDAPSITKGSQNARDNGFAANISGNAYFDGDVRTGQTANFTVGGSMTVNGTFYANMEKSGVAIDKDLCLGNNAKIRFTPSANKKFIVGENTWIPKADAIEGANEGNSFSYRTFGNTEKSKTYIKSSFPCNGYYNISGNSLSYDPSNSSGLRPCPDNLFIQSDDFSGSTTGTTDFAAFTTKGSLYSSYGSEKPESMVCGDTVKTHCDAIWQIGKGIGCEGEDRKVPDLLQTGYDEFVKFVESPKKPSCLSGVDKISPANLTKMENCYNSLKDDSEQAAAHLYNGFLVVDLKPDGNASSNVESYTLDGKYIFIYENYYNYEQVRFPSTTDNSVVFVYLRGGAKGYLMTGKGKYFVFTEKTVGGVNKGTWEGSLYASAANCASIRDMNGRDIQTKFDQNVVNALSSAGVICPASATECGGTDQPEEVPPEEGEEGYDAADVSYDADFIAVGTQLSIESETQYKNTEAYDDAIDIEPSAVVLPRVIYLNRDAVGKLSDYYMVSSLNGAAIQGYGSVNCPSGAPPTSGQMFDGKNLMKEGIFVCNYVEGSDAKAFKSKFYIVVNGLTSQNPPIKFEGESNVVLDPTAEHSVEISINIDKSSGTARQFKVDIAVGEIPDGWDLVANTSSNFVKRTGSSGLDVYTYTGTTSAVAQSVKLFTVKTPSMASSGGASFRLQTPDGCTIVSPTYKMVTVPGQAVVERHELKEYCVNFPYSEECTDENLKRADCSEYVTKGKTWVFAKASTTSCDADPANPNNIWNCMSDPEVRLMKNPTYIPEYCEAVIPLENNTASVTSNEMTYPLYASVLGRRYTLTVEIKGEKHHSYANICKQDGECQKCESGTCKYDVYGGETYVLTAVEESGDIFSYWGCKGKDCADDPITDKKNVLKISSDNTGIATFNERDKHCFYEDFSSLYAFCKEGETSCIQECKNSNGCSMNQAIADWMMMYTNGKKRNEAPEVDATDHYIWRNIEGNANNQSGTQTLILRNSEAGFDGMMNVMFQTSIRDDKSNGGSAILNSGFILRSNADATDYMVLLLYGKVGSGNLTARVCHGDGQGLNNANKAQCTDPVTFKTAAGNYVGISTTTMVKAKIHITGEKLIIDATANDTEASAEISLAMDPYDKMMNTTYNYVGMALSDATFHLYDIGWASETYNEECFAKPKVSCVFKANYLGGIVPLDEAVMPWVGASSWYENNECTYEYYYNGNDNAVAGLGMPGIGLGADRGVQVTGYRFTQEGIHGAPYTMGSRSGYKNDAKVKVVCPSTVTSSLANEVVSCGIFNVGDMILCHESMTLLDGSENGSADNAVEINFESKNLRDANIVFDVKDAADDANIYVTLVDENGRSSDIATFVGPGEKKIAMNDVSNVDGFDPQKVVKVVISADGFFGVSNVQSACPHAMSLRCKSADYDSKTNMWKIMADINNAASCGARPAAGSNSGAKSQTHSPCTNGTFYLGEVLASTNNSVEYKFTVSAKSENGVEETCNISRILDGNSSSSAASSSSAQSSSSTTGTSFGVACGEIPTQTYKDPGDVIYVTPHEVRGCEEATCFYEVKFGSKSLTGGLKSAYDGGDVVFTDPKGTGEREYNLTIYSPHKKHSQSCKFKVSYNTAESSTSSSSTPSGSCHCTCKTGCNNVITTGWDGNLSGCYFATSGEYIGAYSGSVVNVNGTDLIDNWYGWNTGSNTTIESLPKKDGGWYIQVVSGSNVEPKFSGGTPNCNGGTSGGTSSQSTASSSSQATSSAGGTGNTVEVHLAYGSEYDFEPGKTYSLTCGKQWNSERQLVCKTLNNSTHYFNYGGESIIANSGYGSASATCSATAKTVTTTQTVRCKNDY
ncbi:MAG: hypothetical protein MJY82_03745 [Fibrobacter sp.]|nr:hypothetical protein [Fibrobacter sp.]